MFQRFSLALIASVLIMGGGQKVYSCDLIGFITQVVQLKKDADALQMRVNQVSINVQSVAGGTYNLVGFKNTECLTAEQKEKIQAAIKADATYYKLWFFPTSPVSLFFRMTGYIQVDINSKITTLYQRIALAWWYPSYFCNQANANALQADINSVRDAFTQVNTWLIELEAAITYVRDTLRPRVQKMIDDAVKSNSVCTSQGTNIINVSIAAPQINPQNKLGTMETMLRTLP